jgi:hypothetical protein
MVKVKAEKRRDFPQSVREKLLLWCDRHCCLCKKKCDVFIEIHHIGSPNDNTADNAIPLCFECHGRVSHYDDSQPKGTKFKAEELKMRRQQIYEEFSRHLVPALDYAISQRIGSDKRTLPDVGFTIVHMGNAPPVKAFVELKVYINGLAKDIGDANETRYRGKIAWHLNPLKGISGHFQIPQEALNGDVDVRVGVNITVHDCYDLPHKLLPLTYVYDRKDNDWWLDPVAPEESAKELKKSLDRRVRVLTGN